MKLSSITSFFMEGFGFHHRASGGSVTDTAGARSVNTMARMASKPLQLNPHLPIDIEVEEGGARLTRVRVGDHRRPHHYNMFKPRVISAVLTWRSTTPVRRKR